MPADMRALLGRRGFLKAGAAAAVLGTAGTAGAPSAVAAPDAVPQEQRPQRDKHRVPPEAVSIQLYTMRELMDADLDGTFAGLAAIGYRKVEQAGFHGRTAREFKRALDAHGLRATSGHQSPYPYDESRWRKMIEDAFILGQRYMVEPLPAFIATGLVSPLSPPSLAWGQYAHDLNKAAEQAGIFGIEVGYHNHNVEFLPLPDDPGRTGYDILLAETDPGLVHFELDLYWAWRAGQDPVELLEAHPTRFRQFHVKDMDENGDITAPGAGVIDFARVFQAAANLGITEYIVEQDNAGQNAMETARLGFDLLSTIRW
ncbi:TIM barrel protein [Streptomyces sp. 5K101]|uniref:sugar phosphate isomerase/epimerase family protein n=1 Tax=Streptomyces sp. 5K101 TaxID=3390037 RepID=UPI0039756DA5